LPVHVSSIYEKNKLNRNANCIEVHEQVVLHRTISCYYSLLGKIFGSFEDNQGEGGLRRVST